MFCDFRKQKGVTLIEIIVVVFIVAIFSLVLIGDFPEIQKRYALSGATYKLAQDFRKVQDLGLSGVELKDENGDPITIQGYGIYVDASLSDNQYIIYADVGDKDTADQKYDGDFSSGFCSNQVAPESDCIIEIVDVSENNQNIQIEGFDNINGDKTSVNFSPPNPIINIENLNTNLQPPDNSRVGIVLGIRSESITRTVWVNTSGLINAE